jgi:hypothetical protein
MQRGSILETARADTSSGVIGGAINMTEQEARAVVTTLAGKVAGIVPDDAKVFGTRWNQDRAACENEAKARRSLPRSA